MENCEFPPSITKQNLEFFNKFAQTATKKIEIATTTIQERKGAPGNNPLNCENCRKTATKERKEKGGEGKWTVGILPCL